MEKRMTVITLGVGDVERSKAFYASVFGWEVSSASQDDIVFFKTPGVVVALYPSKLLAEDATVPHAGSGFRAVTFAHNLRRKEEVAPFLARAVESGGKMIKKAQDVFWGGHSGYFADPDGHLWEVAWNPYFEWDAQGAVKLP